jgi:hypothetical protein
MESTQITPHPSRPDAAMLAFNERYQAEKFLNHGTDIPHGWPTLHLVPLSSLHSQRHQKTSTWMNLKIWDRDRKRQKWITMLLMMMTTG